MMAQLLAHLWGDYILQSHWMAENKTKRHCPALVHAVIYSLCFLPLCWGHVAAFAVILSTHFYIDRFGLARYFVWVKNFIAPVGHVVPRWDGQKQESVPRRFWSWSEASATGYAPNMPAWLAVWLLIIADNTLHLTINYLALRYL